MKFQDLDSHIAWVVCAFVGLIAVFIVMIVFVGGVQKERREQCRQAGGVPIKNGYQHICLDRDAVINVEEQPR